ncbi:MAG: TRAP transporter large permease [Alphaproteobacteria bacterium]
MIEILPIGLLLVLFVLGMPIGIGLGISGLVGLYLVGGLDVTTGLLALTPYRESASFILSSVPMFILMAEFATRGGLVRDLYDAAHSWLGHYPGGLGLAAVASCAAMGAMSGASTAAAAAVAGASMREMDRYGYNRAFSSGTIASGGTLAIMIPPSIPMVIYGVQTQTSIGQLFVAGIVPGIITMFAYMITVWAWVSLRPGIAPRVAPKPVLERVRALRHVWAVLMLVVLIIGGMYGGLFTPTEAGAVGAGGALAITLVLGRLRLGQIKPALYSAAVTTAMLMTIVVGAHFFSFYLTLAGVTGAVSAFISGLPMSPIFTMILIIVPIYIVLGMFMDNVPILLLTLPVLFPVVTQMGYDPIWFGVIVVALGEIGLITPPVGLSVFVVSSVARVPLEDVFKGITPFLLADAGCLALFIAVPTIATFLPNLMR